MIGPPTFLSVWGKKNEIGGKSARGKSHIREDVKIDVVQHTAHNFLCGEYLLYDEDFETTQYHSHLETSQLLQGARILHLQF